MLQKRLDYGSNGFQVPFIPKAARSSRRRGGVGKKAEDNQLCAFDLLATVAGNLLLEGETSQNTPVEENQAVNYEDVVMEEQHEEVNPSKIEHCDQPGSDNPPFNLVLGSLNAGIETVPKDNASLIPAVVDKIDLNDHLGDEFCNHLAKPEQCSAAVPKDFDMRNQGEDLSQNSSYKQSLSTNNYTSGSVSPSRGGTNVNNNNDNIVKVVSRDDDENSSGCTHPSSLKLTRWPPRAGGRRIRRLLASKHRRVAPKLKDRDVSETELRYVYCGRKNGYKRQRSQRIYPFKKRKSFYYRTLSNCDRNINYKSIYSPEKGLDKSTASFGAVGHGVKGSSSSVSGQSTSFQSRESQVKVRIKSFRVPELFIEMPETATIGSLKRTVMETLTTLLGGGLHVGVLFQGKKMRDDNRTLLQSGIGRNDKVDSLGFTLEPNCVDANVPISSEDNSLVLSSDVPQPLSRCPDASMMNGGTCHPSSSDHPMNSIGHLVESDHDSAPSPGETSGDKGTVDSRALVAVPEGTPQALSVIPAHHKSRRAEMAQRRIRRPFSVTEVEALVQAVEQLGTGRWRDVKLRAFDDAKHRTYVDLKDKWKTLVHTARISPQQRRGEPVPQELLDRVLAAHAYWSQQAKQQLKQQPEPCLLL